MVEAGIDGTADTAFIWAYRSPAGADYHAHRPRTISGQPYLGEAAVVGRPTQFDWAELGDWAHKYAYSRKVMREQGKIIDVARFVRRLLRLRAGILDALPQTRPGEVRGLLQDRGITVEMLPDDLAELVDLTG